MARVRGFILQASYRVSSVSGGRRVPVVHLYGRLESGAPFLIRDGRQRPHFYVRASDAAAPALEAWSVSPTDRRTFGGEAVARVDVTVPSDVPPLRDKLHAGGIDTFEGDVRFASRYLIERNIKGGCEIEGEPTAGPAGTVFDDPILHPASVTISPRVLSFDIETDAKGERLLAISLFAPGVDEVLIVDGSERPMPERATRCANERAALEAFEARVRTLDPDVLTGWNIIDFDLSVLEKIAARVGSSLMLGRDEGAMRIRKAEGYFGSGQASIPGRLVLDGIDLLRGAFIRMDDYSLDAVAREVLGEGKAMAGDARDRLGEIIYNYKHDLPAFALYARTDARLAYQIVEKLRLVELAFARSQLTGMTPDRVAASIASFDFLYLSELEHVSIVAPSVRGGDSRVHVAQQGGHVLEPATGLHANVWVFDFKSLYPSIIRTFNIDPVSFVPGSSPAGDGLDLIDTPGGSFRRDPAILPRLLDELFPRREAAKRRRDDVAAHAIKILMNSFYGVLGTSACRFYNPALANSITGMGKKMLLWSKAWFESAGLEVLYGDTDSLFVRAAESDPERASAEASRLVAALNVDLSRHIEIRWRVKSRLELEFEKLYIKLFLPHARHSSRGASKRYAGLVYEPRLDAAPRADTDSGQDVEPRLDPAIESDSAPGRVEFVGMEVVRRDWTALAKRVQRELYERLFGNRPVDAYLADIVARVRRGELDAELVYHKNLRKGASDYTATTPPHVAAARKSKESPGRSVRYLMTTAGAEPLDNLRHPVDREHYVEKQVRPVAEPVLEALGLEFERVIGDARQFELNW
jgi:DNA polymerase II